MRYYMLPNSKWRIGSLTLTTFTDVPWNAPWYSPLRLLVRPWRRCDSTKGRGRMRRRPRDSVMCRQSGDMAFVVHTLMQDPNDIDTICRLTIKQNVRSGRIHAVASAHLGAFPA